MDISIINTEEIILTIREGLLLCVKHEIKGATKQLESFDKNKKLATNQLKKFKENFECLYEEVTITGGGQSGRVILKGLKDTPSQRITGNSKNGKKPSNADITMKEYLFVTICKFIKPHQSKNYTVNQLVNLLDLLSNPTVTVSASIETELQSILAAYYTNEQIIHIKSNAMQNISNRKESDIKLHIEHLQKEKLIRVETIYNAKYREDAYAIEFTKHLAIENGIDPNEISLYQKISEEKYNDIKDAITGIAELYGFTYKDYVQASRGLMQKYLAVNQMMKKVKEYLAKSGYDFIFTSMDITILNYDIDMQTTTRIQAKKAFEDKLIDSTNKRMKKETYTNKTSYTKEFYRLAMFIILRKIGVKDLDAAINDEILKVSTKHSEMNYLYNLKKAEEDNREWAY